MSHSLRCLRRALDELHERYNRREFVHPDPLEFLYDYADPADREIVAVLAASLAYGRVAQILRSVRSILDRMGPSPRLFLERTSPRDLPALFAGFRHRWTSGAEVAGLLAGVRHMLDRRGSLAGGFLARLHPEDENVLPALRGFVDELRSAGRIPRNSLLPDVAAGGACKRMHLMLRWLVRRDGVDPGGWDEISPHLLIIPLDTHMHRIGSALGLLRRRSADCRAALALTAAFSTIQPADPVRYDFALTRLGIRPELDPAAFLARCRQVRSQRGRER